MFLWDGKIFQAPHSNNPILSVYRGVGGIVIRIRWSTQCVSRRLIMINLGTAWLLWLMFWCHNYWLGRAWSLIIVFALLYIQIQAGYLYSVLMVCKSILAWFYSWHFVKIKWKVDFSLIRAQKSLFHFLIAASLLWKCSRFNVRTIYANLWTGKL